MLNINEFNSIKDLLYKLTGISIGEQKEIMVYNRMKRFAKSINYDGDIIKLIDSVNNGNFKNEFINAFTTNKTHFFREKYHFIDLMDRVIPNINRNQTHIKVLSSGCSTGEESYSIAISFFKSIKKLNSNLNMEIIATDIDTDVLKVAKNGKYILKSYNIEFPEWIEPTEFFEIKNNEFNIKEELKRVISFRELNLMASSYPFKNSEFDIIFCRNVLIYFSQQDQKWILKKLFKHLKVGGTLYIGHSENPIGLEEAIERIGHNIFLKTKELS